MAAMQQRRRHCSSAVAAAGSSYNMPKIKTSRGKPKAKPYTKHLNEQQHNKTIVTKKDAPRQSSRFLELPVEIRMQIYDLFCTVPSKKGQSIPPERSSVMKARGNLLLTCRQIHQEFAPDFYRSVDIKIHNWWALGGGLGPGKAGSLSQAIGGFERLFLKTLAIHKLQSIRRLELDVSVGPELLFLSTSASAAHRSTRRLTDVLSKHIHNLKSLCEVSMFETVPQEKNTGDWLLPILKSDLQTRNEDFWDSYPGTLEWDIMAARYLQSPIRLGFLQSWTLTMEAWIQTRSSQAFADELGCYYLVNRVGITFRKSESTELPLPAPTVVRKLNIEWDTP
ncbi:hypothetical protein PV05_08406 [Exophiala xenobiotica]|uniref:F-box domain-containing protein n=1 Tax=Exophiala xenobiotica TaxID=348802 RepID=A0A0D2EDL2_9EURO|nr:uncharacterized protein PV05_08406 [Exophiala xenobiotica]KIW52785.1 hypothetical protein PV05_08406 [Exophiala xenobiotica]